LEKLHDIDQEIVKKNRCQFAKRIKKKIKLQHGNKVLSDIKRELRTNGCEWVGLLLFLYYFDPIRLYSFKFALKNFDPYLTITDQPDPCKVIKYLLIILSLILINI
jgi:hypothetical protein